MFSQGNIRYSLCDMNQEPNIIQPSSRAPATGDGPRPTQNPVQSMDVISPPTPQTPVPQPAATSPDPIDTAEDETVVIQPTVAPPPDLAPTPAVIHENGTEEDEYVEDTPGRKDGLKSTFTTLAILIAAPLIAILLTTFIFQSYEVDGESMETTLQNNDRLIVWKAPVTFAKLTSSTYIPARSEIIIFHKQETSSALGTGDKQLIKRVIGLPGERVVVQDGSIRVYNAEHPDGFDPDATGQYTITAETTPGTVDITVPEGEVFVVGDNRTNSLDSRVLGPIRSDEIIGELSFRIFPFNKAKHY